MANGLLTIHANDSMDSERSSIRIISSTCPELRNGPSDVKDILSASFSGYGNSKTLVQVNSAGGVFIWTHEVFEPASWTLDQARVHVEGHLLKQNMDAIVILCDSNEAADEKTGRTKTFMISVLSLDAESAQSVPIPYHDRLALEENRFQGISHLSSSRRGFIHRNLAFIITAAILAILAITLSITTVLHHKSSSNPNIWLSWSLPSNSIGPQHQLQFTWPHPNFTSWSTSTGHSVSDFYLRLDDQTLIPTQYVSDYERQYQAWYAKHYPWFAEVGNSKAYLNESYWRDSRSYPLAIDHDFHVAHCVLTMKRYWTAKESGHHVCARDIDYKHISHCFGVLESYAVKDFETSHRMDPQVNGTDLMWIVNACF